MSKYQGQKGTFIKSDFSKEEIEFEKRYGKDAKYIFNGKVIRRK